MTLEEFLEQARREIDRVNPAEAAELLRTGDAVLVDIRPQSDRSAEGEIPGFVPVERIVLEWRLGPA